MLLIIEINRQQCMGCAYCSLICPVASFKVFGVSHFMQKCIKCGLCVMYCPVSAIIPLWEE
ncbi:MAG: 4Fe-4S binding protein [Promethearchaeota archaeon]